MPSDDKLKTLLHELAAAVGILPHKVEAAFEADESEPVHKMGVE